MRLKIANTALISSTSGRCRRTSILEVLRDLAAIPLHEEGGDDEDQSDNATQVFFVTNQNAKALRTALEGEGLLDKKYRMVKADEKTRTLSSPAGHIAIPIKGEGLNFLSRTERPSWAQLVVATGQQQMPLSTAIMGAKKQRSK